MSDQTILFQVESGVATITLHRPESYNAFNEAMSRELMAALKTVAKDDQIRCLVITGSGSKAFCSGQDLKDALGKERNLGDSVRQRYNPLIMAIRALSKPVIARVNGVAAGAGASLVFACDYIIAAEHAAFMQAFVKIGLVPDSGSSWFLPQNIGYHRAFELATMGDKLSAQKAMEWGLVNVVVPEAELDQRVKVVTDYYAAAPTMAVGMIKKMLNKAMHSDLEEALLQEAYAQEVAGRSEDYREGVEAFVAKRSPQFKGR